LGTSALCNFLVDGSSCTLKCQDVWCSTASLSPL
jgi:hypothetical protein